MGHSSSILKNEIILGNINWIVPTAKNQKFRVILFGGGEGGSNWGKVVMEDI